MSNFDYDYEDYFFCKYSSHVSDLFLNIREISNSFCINIFNNYKQTLNGTNNLQEFLFDNLILEDEKNEETNSDTDNDELNFEENLY